MITESFRFYIYNGQVTDYMISNKGNVISVHHYKKNKTFQQGFKRVKPYKCGRKGREYLKVRVVLIGKQISVSRMVAETFIPNPDNKPCVDHINGNRFDNRVENLRWCTNKENHNYSLARSNHRAARIRVIERKLEGASCEEN